MLPIHVLVMGKVVDNQHCGLVMKIDKLIGGDTVSKYWRTREFLNQCGEGMLGGWEKPKFPSSSFGIVYNIIW